MKTLYYLMILVICLAPVTYSQVDTLEAIEVGTIQAPSNITQLYVQDLNGDSLNELILCTSNHVYAYNQADSIPFWTSPDLVRPSDLQFADINGDSLLDVSVKDSLNIFLFDIYASALIFTTTTNNLYCCYTIGDANGDGAGDLAIVRQEPFDRDMRPDTIWMDLSNGPDFINSSNCSIPITNYEYQNSQSRDYFRQIAKRLTIAQLGSGSIHYPRINLSTDITRGLVINSAHRSDTKFYGGMWQIDPQAFQVMYSNEDLGNSEFIDIQESQGEILLYSIMSYRRELIQDLNFTYTRSYHIIRFNESGLVNSLLTVAYGQSTQGDIPNWTFAVGNLNSNFDGSELCYGFMDSLTEYSIQNDSTLWSVFNPVDSMAVTGIFKSWLFPYPEILIRESFPDPQFLFVNGTTHQINTILPITIPTISNISDLNHDGNDEILSISGNTLHIYNLEWATPVAERPILPSEYLTVSNYPNPFNGQTIIKYNLPNQCDIALEIYDILGRKIESFEKPNQPAGLGKITWDASGEPSGVYFYRLSAGNEQKNGRMVLLK